MWKGKFLNVSEGFIRLLKYCVYTGATLVVSAVPKDRASLLSVPPIISYSYINTRRNF